MSDENKKIKQKSKEYPAVTLGKAIEFIEALKGYPIGKPISYGTAATELKVSETTKSFRYTLSAAKQYGLISTSGKVLTFLESANRIARPTEDEIVLKELKMECFSTPKIYSELIQEYKGRSLPPIKTLENILITNHGIAPNVANSAAQTFIDTANEVDAIKNGVVDLSIEKVNISDEADENPGEAPNTSEQQDNLLSFEKKEGFEQPLTIPFGNQRKAILYMPTEITKADAEYAKIMILAMFKQLYDIDM